MTADIIRGHTKTRQRPSSSEIVFCASHNDTPARTEWAETRRD